MLLSLYENFCDSIAASWMVSLSIGSLKVAKLFSPMLMLAKLVLLQLTLIPKSDSTSHVQGCSSSLSFGHLYDGPGGMYSAIANSRNRRTSSTGRRTKMDDIVDERPKLEIKTRVSSR
ncbi:unnamed protein product [Callosobruchus maculatus]|uniref:Uncharacterized protein n=1 Tax=Callosobruchus maculatus TaxID=64391 RepID=A0A653DNZ2_CALMS|nr:unnamed protein product [Callosobruchus maculatus]